MSNGTQTTGCSQTSAPTATPRPIPLARHVRVELRKMVDTRVGLWLFMAIAVGTACAVVLYGIFSPEDSRTFAGYAGVALTPQGLLLPVLGILLVTSEWDQRTGLITFTLEPQRGLVMLAKVLAASIIGLGMLAVALVVAGAANALGGASAQGAGGLTARTASHMALMQLLGMLQGVGLGLLLMSSAAAIVVYFVLPTVSSLVFTLVGGLSGLAPWLDFATAQESLGSQALAPEQWAQLATTCLIWVGIPSLLGFVRLRRAEIKTA